MVSSGEFSACFCAFLTLDGRPTAIAAQAKSRLPQQKNK
jgi:hypothetical protein